jgi:hypothetical protein
MGINEMIIDDDFIDLLGINLAQFSKKPKPKLFLKDGIYYKIWDQASHPYYTFNGLDLIWEGHDTLASVKVGLINDLTCPAFKDLLFNNDRVCIGYSMYEGSVIDKTDSRYEPFIKILVEQSLKFGYCFNDASWWNIIDYKGTLSLIDIDFPPAKIFHNKTLTETEQKRWNYIVDSQNKSDYFLALMEELTKNQNDKSK